MAPVTPVRAVNEGQCSSEVLSTDGFHDMQLVDLFHEPCPGWAVPGEFMAIALDKLSQHHPGHLRVRTAQSIKHIVDVTVYHDIHDLAAFSGWAPRCLVNLLDESKADWNVVACAKDLCVFAAKLREWCLWPGRSTSVIPPRCQREQDAPLSQEESRAIALQELESPKKGDRPPTRSRSPHRPHGRGQEVSHLKRTPSPRCRSTPRPDQSSKSSKKSEEKKSESSSPQRSRSRRLLRIESTLQRVSHKKFGEDFVPCDEDIELSDYIKKRADMSKTVDELVAERKLEVLDVDFLPEPRTIVDLHKVFSQSHVPYISQKPLEEVIPVYLLQGLPPSQKTEVLKKRQTEVPTMARLLENVLAFWTAHHVAGMVDLGAIVQHTFLLLKMA